MTGPELYLLETRRDRTRGLTQLQGACRPPNAFLGVMYGTADSSMHCWKWMADGRTCCGQERE